MRTNTDKKVNLIRRNNQEKVTAYHDSVMLHLQKGENGIIPEVGEQFRPEYNSLSKTLTIHSGMAVIYGRQFEVVETDQKKINFSGLENGQKITIWAEIDLRDPTEGTAIIKTQKVHPVEDFFKPLAGDNLIKTPNGIARMELFRITYNHDNKGENSILNIVNRFKVLSNDWIANASFATNSLEAKNSVKIGGIAISDETDIIRAKMIDSSTSDIVERKRCIFKDETSVGDRGAKGLLLHSKNNGGNLITIEESIKEGDTLEFVYVPDYDNVYEYFKCYTHRVELAKGSVILNHSAPVWSASANYHVNFLFDSFIISGSNLEYEGGEKLLLAFGGSISFTYKSKTMLLKRIYKIIGGNAI